MAAKESVTCRRLESFADAAPLAHDWDALVARSGGHIFMTYDWLACWWEHFGQEGALRLYVVESSTEGLVGVAPLYRVRRRLGGVPVWMLCMVGDHEAGADYLTWPMRQGYAKHAKLVAEALWQEPDWDVLEYFDAPAEDLALTNLRHWCFVNDVPSHLSHCRICPVLTVQPSTMDGFMAMPDKVYKKVIRKDKDKFAKKHSMRVRSATAATLPQDLERFFDLHAQRWEALGEAGNFVDPTRRAFFEAISARCMALGRLRLDGMEVDGAIEAMEYGVVFAGKHYFLQAGRSQAGSKVKAGNLLLMEIILRSLTPDADVQSFHFLWGDEPYKYQIGALPQMTITFRAPRTRRGRLAMAARQCQTGARALLKGLR